MSLNTKHLFHVFALISFVAVFVAQSIYQQVFGDTKPGQEQQRQQSNALALTLILTTIQVLAVSLNLPQVLFGFFGLIFYNAFPGAISKNEHKSSDVNKSPLDNKILQEFGVSPPNGDATRQEIPKENKLASHLNLAPELKTPPPVVMSPHLCFRIVTRGLYPALVQRNVNKNFLTCIESGLLDFSIEVVTDKEIYLSNASHRIRQIVVPRSYRSSTGALYKARALQFALEPGSSPVKEGNYIIHLDEETLLTPSSIYGIVNFANKDEHSFGQGLITYASQEIVNWVTTLADSYRVADDMGKLRFQLRAFHKPLFGWKGSYVVTKYEAEKDVSFDHGLEGSIAEDCYFGMEAIRKGYTFDFIDGEMWEKSPFTILDLIRQRKRWFQGIWLVVHSSKIPISTKFLLAMSHYGLILLPLGTTCFVLTLVLRLQASVWLTAIGAFCFSVTIYMYFFGVIKSFSTKKSNVAMILVYVLSQLIVLPLNIVCENISVIWGLIDSKQGFYIVGKDASSGITIEAA